MLHFCDTDFLVSMKFPYLQELSCLYKKEVGLPFMMQAGAETINEGNIKLLKEMNCITMSIGVETGSESLRRKVLHKNISNERIKYAFRLAKEYGIRTTANYMIGLPFETEEDVMESIRFNKELLPPSIAVTYFIPFVGTEFYNLCIEKGYYKKFDPDADTYRESPLETEYLSNRRINELLDIFVQEYNKEIKKRPLPTSLIRPKI
jgi:radical SAM superfamily enzyme YgiQ (UPF0313 family)